MKKAKVIVISTFITLIIAFIFIGLISLISSKSGNTMDKSISLISTIAACISILTGSIIVSVLIREKGVIYGVLNAGIFILISSIISVLLFGYDFSFSSFPKIIALILSGAVGGVLGVNKKNKIKF